MWRGTMTHQGRTRLLCFLSAPHDYGNGLNEATVGLNDLRARVILFMLLLLQSSFLVTKTGLATQISCELTFVIWLERFSLFFVPTLVFFLKKQSFS